MDAVQQLFPKAAEYASFGQHNGWAPCDETTPIGRARISYWAAAGFGQVHVWCTVSAKFGPCRKPDPIGGGGGIGGGIPGNVGGPGTSPGSGPGGAPSAGTNGIGTGTVAIVTTVENSCHTGTVQAINLPPANTTSHPIGANDPSTIVRAGQIAEATGISGPLSTGFFQYDDATLALALAGLGQTIAEVYHAANQNSVPASMANVDTELNLPFFLEGLMETVVGGGPGSPPGGTPPPIPPGCGALGIEFILGISLLTSLLRRIIR
jgi:hypothetical protein